MLESTYLPAVAKRALVFPKFAQMGCVCAKEAYILDYPDTPKSSRGPGSNRFSIRWLTGSRSTKEERHLHNENSYLGNVSKLKRKGSHPVGSIQIDTQKRAERFRADSDLNVLLSNPPNHTQAEQVAAGWPAWLAAVAGEAIKGWIPRKADSFEKLIKIGQGTYSNVYKARDLDSGKIVALKKVRFDNFEPESVRFMAREIQVLHRLDHPNVVKLEGLVTSGVSCNLYLVFEYMEHDLAGLAACPGIKFTEPQVKCYMQQLLCGLDHCHSRGVLHRDIKGSNLLIDNGGILKIADFGLANFFHPDQKQLLTSRVVTLWYRPPELLLGATDYGVAVDLWSTGCILAELLYGKPIMPGRTEVEQLHKIFKLCGSPSEEYWQNSKLPHATIFKPQQPYRRCVTETFKDFPLSALTLLETLLAIEPGNRGVAAGALKSEFFATKPLPCDPASLPKYPPSKELDAKIHAEEARRQGNARGMGRGSEAAKGASRESRAGPQADASAELAPSIQKLGPSSHGASNIMNEKFNPQLEDDTVGFCVNPPRPVHSFFEVTGVSLAHTLLPGPARSGPMSYPDISHSKIQKKQKDEGVQIFSGQPSKSLTVSDFKTQGISGRQHAAELLNFSRLETGRNYDGAGTHKDWSSLPQLNQVECVENGKSEFSGVPDFSAKQNNTQLQGPESLHRLEGFHLRDMPRENHWRDERPASREPLVGSCDQERIHYSGPLLPSYENIDDILEKHERHIQRAVRRARQGRGEASRNYSSHSGTKVFENKGGVSTAKGNTDSSKLKGGLTTSISGIQQKVNKSCVTEQIVDGRKYEGKPLSSIMGNFQREQES